jgi:HAD superfamily hydrolase (TIGR01490 family)
MTPIAFFDVDGTILAGDIVRHFVRLRTWDMHPMARALWTGAFVFRLPYLLVLDGISRARFQRALYAGYRAGAPADLARRVPLYSARWLEPRLFPGAVARIAQHLQENHRVVLVTGSLAPIVAPIAARVRASAVLAPRLREVNGAFTGEIDGEPLAGQRKAEAALRFATQEGIAPSTCFAYADSQDDLPLLECVGHATVVNPGGRLQAIATARGWDILHWSATA